MCSVSQNWRGPLLRFKDAVACGGSIKGPHGKAKMFTYYACSVARVKRIFAILSPFLCDQKRSQFENAISKWDRTPAGRRGFIPGSGFTVCPKGHEYAVTGTYQSTTQRHCKACTDLRNRENKFYAYDKCGCGKTKSKRAMVCRSCRTAFGGTKILVTDTQTIVQLHRSGSSAKELSAQFNVNKSTIYKVLRRNKTA